MNFTYELLYTVAIFSACSLINVILNTFKTIIMYKKNIISSANINAITYGFYTVIVVLMAGTMPLWIKIVATAITNWIGVCISMKILKKFEKDKVWKVELKVPLNYEQQIRELLSTRGVEIFDGLKNEKNILLTCICPSQKESKIIGQIAKAYNTKPLAYQNVWF